MDPTTEVHTQSVEAKVVSITLVNDGTDRVSLARASIDPMMMPGLAITFECPRGTYKTGDKFLYTETVTVLA